MAKRITKKRAQLNAEIQAAIESGTQITFWKIMTQKAENMLLDIDRHMNKTFPKECEAVKISRKAIESVVDLDLLLTFLAKESSNQSRSEPHGKR